MGGWVGEWGRCWGGKKSRWTALFLLLLLLHAVGRVYTLWLRSHSLVAVKEGFLKKMIRASPRKRRVACGKTFLGGRPRGMPGRWVSGWVVE